ncbi:547_t:CDS:2 [Ambispora gerdemannii]|uniref:547_t:CDS:1 n=1 Tax=Ambispora gerdemannii TaxID=144530 RepID=A0A9N9GA98_9GLOM|nr:547_t:CDS:2 [Ambispora gerdemannii]
MTERVKGDVQYASGAAKEAAGAAIGNEQLKAEGTAAKVEGTARVEAAKAGGRAGGTGTELKGTVKEAGGNILDNQQMKAEGKTDKATGQGKCILCLIYVCHYLLSL